MKKFINLINKNYMYINITMLLLSIYVIFFPIISIPIKNLIPSFGECPFLKMTGHPCPLCGGTRYIANIGQVFNNITYLFNPFGIMVIVIILEIIYRVYYLMHSKKIKNIETIIKVDLLIHLIILISFVLYEITFFYI